MLYFQNIGTETISREYKEFTFNHGGLNIDSEFANELVKTSKWIKEFNSMILESIAKYMTLYIPKYTGAFLDEKSDTNNGEFYIGISDDGTIQGIPYQGEIDTEFIFNEFDNIITNFISSNNLITDSIKIEIIPIKYEPRELDEYPPIYYDYLKYQKKIIKKQLNYSIKLKEWYKNHFKYAQKLVDIFNLSPTREELEEYIRIENGSLSVLKLIRNKKFMLETRSHEEISELKNYPNEPYYWVCKFKDEFLDRVRKERPINIIKNDILTYLNPISILIKVSHMIPWWMQNNKNMNLYVIKITYKKNLNNNCIYYYDRKNKRNRCYRTITENKPCCARIF